MDKIKFDIDYFKNNKVVINCKSLDEVKQFKEILDKYNLFTDDMEDGFYRYGSKVCFECEYNIIWFQKIKNFKNENYEILDFTGFSDTQFCNKTTILKEDIELKNGDIINTKDYGYGMVINDIIIYAKHYGWDEKDDIINDIVKYLPFEILKQQDFYEEYKGCIVEQLLFRNELEDNIKSLMIKVEKPTTKTKTKIYYINRNKYSLSYTNKYISDEILNLKDMCCIDTGLLKGEYGRIIAIKEEELTEEEISKYNKISSIGNLYE